MKKRIALVALCLLLVVSVFAGCKTTGEGQTAENDKYDPNAEVEVSLGIWPEDTMTDDIAMHEGFVAKLKETNPNITYKPANYKYATDSFVALAEGGNLPTVFETWFTEPQKLIKGEYVKDITADMQEMGWADKMSDNIKSLLSKDGKIYGTPRDGYALGLYINMNLFEQAGLVNEDGTAKYPKTFDELYDAAKTIKEKTGQSGFVLLGKDNAGGWHFSNIAWNYGATLQTQNADGKWEANLNSAEVLEAMKWVQKMIKDGLTTANPADEDWASGFVQLGTGKAAMYIAAQDAVNQPTQVNGLEVNKLSLVPVPAGSKAQYSLMGGTPYMFAGNATRNQVMGALKYLEVRGKAPELTADAKEGLAATYKLNKEEGVPNIPTFQVWKDADLLTQQAEVRKDYENVDMKLFDDYFNKVAEEGNIKAEEPNLAQEMYAEFTKVIQALVQNNDMSEADLQAALDTADKNFQALLDDEVND